MRVWYRPSDSPRYSSHDGGTDYSHAKLQQEMHRESLDEFCFWHNMLVYMLMGVHVHKYKATARDA